MKYHIIDDSKVENLTKSDARGDDLVNFNIKIPTNAIKFLKVPYVPNGFENSCSEASAEMILRYWKIQNWSQYEIHQYGYQTFEGFIAEGDLGLLNFFKYENFITEEGKKINFHVDYVEEGTLADLRKYLDKGIPIIIRYFTNNRGDKHTVVLIGYNKEGFFKHDNDMGESLFMGNEYLNKAWTKHYILIYPTDFLK
jgi:hypothetical protein